MDDDEIYHFQLLFIYHTPSDSHNYLFQWKFVFIKIDAFDISLFYYIA